MIETIPQKFVVFVLISKIVINIFRMSFNNSLKEYQSMREALAERVLDLHCRLTSLYVLQDADCLDWENKHPFFESERGSFVVQMWWLYMEGKLIFLFFLELKELV